MPGINIIRGQSNISSEVVESALSNVEFFDNYETVVLRDDDLLVSYSSYPSYPVTHIEDEEWLIVLEGRLYDVPRTERNDHLKQVVDWAATRNDEALAEWIDSRDGDFVIVGVSKEDDSIVAVTDAFGRLPVYRSSIGDTEVLSRELAFVRTIAAENGDPLSIDRLGTAQALLLGYRLGTRTPFESVDRLPPSTRLQLEPDSSPVQVLQFNFDGKPAKSRSPTENASRLASLFLDACRRRTDEGTQAVVSLSGGLDSRGVAAGYRAADLNFATATFDRVDRNLDSEVSIARRVADILDVPWECFRVRRRWTSERRLLSIKQGANSLSNAPMVDFLDQVRDHFDAPTLITGDGGDKVFPDITPPRRFDDIDELTDYVVAADGRVSLSDAAHVAGVDPETLRETVRSRLASYPESGMRARYVHFYLRERAMNWLFEGEDRNRYYCWTVSPYYSLPFFREAMSCPNKQKRGSDLFRLFLEDLAPDLLDVEYADFAAPIPSLEYRLKRRSYRLSSRYPSLKEVLLSYLVDRGSNQEMENRIQTLATANPTIGELFPASTVEQFVQSSDPNPAVLYDLLTAMVLKDSLARDVRDETPPYYRRL